MICSNKTAFPFNKTINLLQKPVIKLYSTATKAAPAVSIDSDDDSDEDFDLFDDVKEVFTEEESQ